jgi:hypothetical protein
MANKRTVVLRGAPVYNEEGVANEAIRPGYLVKGVGTIALQTSTVLPVAKQFAVERSELGTGLDNTYQSADVATAYYASGDKVKVAVCRQGDQVTAFVASGENVSEDSILASNGDGTLSVLSAYSSGTGPDYPIARSLETLGAAHGVVACRVEIL